MCGIDIKRVRHLILKAFGDSNAILLQKAYQAAFLGEPAGSGCAPRRWWAGGHRPAQRAPAARGGRRPAHCLSIEQFENSLADERQLDFSGLHCKQVEAFHMREFMDGNLFTDTMINNILGPCAIYDIHDSTACSVRARS